MKCFYCKADIAGAWDLQRDHFPVPRSAGGTNTVCACNKCHHFKDRVRPEELAEMFDVAFAQSGDAIAAGWSIWLSAAEVSDAQGAWEAAQQFWELWPTELRLTAGRIMANLARRGAA